MKQGQELLRLAFLGVAPLRKTVDVLQSGAALLVATVWSAPGRVSAGAPARADGGALGSVGGRGLAGQKIISRPGIADGGECERVSASSVDRSGLCGASRGAVRPSPAVTVYPRPVSGSPRAYLCLCAMTRSNHGGSILMH